MVRGMMSREDMAAANHTCRQLSCECGWKSPVLWEYIPGTIEECPLCMSVKLVIRECRDFYLLPIPDKPFTMQPKMTARRKDGIEYSIPLEE